MLRGGFVPGPTARGVSGHDGRLRTDADGKEERRHWWRTRPTQRHLVVGQGPADIKPAAGVMDRRRSGKSQS